MAAGWREPGPDDLVVPFVFVPEGDPDPADWKAAHPGWVKFPATLVPRAGPPDVYSATGRKSEFGLATLLDAGALQAGREESAATGPGSEPNTPPSGSFRTLIAAIDGPVGTLRASGYDQTDTALQGPAPTTASTPKAPSRNAANIDDFFDTLDGPLQTAARELQIPPEWLFGLSAYKSGWLDPHNRRLNNPLGLTHGGGNNVLYGSIDEAIRYFVKRYGPQIRGAKSAADFAARLEGERDGVPVPGWHTYNEKNSDWREGVVRTIASMHQHRESWTAERRPQ